MSRSIPHCELQQLSLNYELAVPTMCVCVCVCVCGGGGGGGGEWDSHIERKGCLLHLLGIKNKVLDCLLVCSASKK